MAVCAERYEIVRMIILSIFVSMVDIHLTFVRGNKLTLLTLLLQMFSMCSIASVNA